MNAIDTKVIGRVEFFNAMMDQADGTARTASIGGLQRKTTMRKTIIALSVIGAVAGFAAATAEAAQRGPAKFYDRNGGFRGYAWCLKQATLPEFDCNYFTYAQCQAAASTRAVYCVPNSFALEQGFNPQAQQQFAPVSRRKVRQQVVY
jgi:hypothetical protein